MLFQQWQTTLYAGCPPLLSQLHMHLSMLSYLFPLLFSLFFVRKTPKEKASVHFALGESVLHLELADNFPQFFRKSCQMLRSTGNFLNGGRLLLHGCRSFFCCG